jgi:hypothetical protein
MEKQFNEFCSAMAEEMNAQAMKHGDSLVTVEQVKRMPEAWAAFALTVRMSSIVAAEIA